MIVFVTTQIGAQEFNYFALNPIITLSSHCLQKPHVVQCRRARRRRRIERSRGKQSLYRSTRRRQSVDDLGFHQEPEDTCGQGVDQGFGVIAVQPVSQQVIIREVLPWLQRGETQVRVCDFPKTELLVKIISKIKRIISRILKKHFIIHSYSQCSKVFEINSLLHDVNAINWHL